jgi:hypothetical protein
MFVFLQPGYRLARLCLYKVAPHRPLTQLRTNSIGVTEPKSQPCSTSACFVR